MTDIKTKLYHKTRHVSKFLTSSPNHKSKRQFLWCKCSSGACAVFTFSSWCISMCVCVCVFVCVCDFCLCASLCSLVCLCLILMTADAAREPRKWSRDRSVRWKTSFIYLVKLKVNTQKKSLNDQLIGEHATAGMTDVVDMWWSEGKKFREFVFQSFTLWRTDRRTEYHEEVQTCIVKFFILKFFIRIPSKLCSI